MSVRKRSLHLTRITALILALAFLGAPGAIVAQNAPAARWDAPQPTSTPLQRRAFRDGLAGARRDIAAHHRPDVNNREEFRHPNVPANARDDYREAFRQGYNLGIQHALGGGDNRL